MKRKSVRSNVRKIRIFEHILLSSTGKIRVTVRKSRQSRQIRITIRPGGAVTVTSPLSVSDRSLFLFLESKLAWIEVKRVVMQKHQTEDVQGTKEEYAEYKERAKELALERLAYWNQYYGFRWQQVTIRNQKTRWGSCSRKGSLSFSYKIALLSQAQADYIIVHELCHLGEFNHSPKFWKLIGKTIPEYEQLRRSLKVS